MHHQTSHEELGHGSNEDRVSVLRELWFGSIIQSSNYIQIKECLLNSDCEHDTGLHQKVLLFRL